MFSYCLVRVSARKLMQDLGLALGEVLSQRIINVAPVEWVAQNLTYRSGFC